MTSLINTSAIDTTYPVAGQDNDTQGFRTNFGSIANNLSIAASEITTLQTGVAALAAFPAPTSEVFYPGTGIAGSKTFVSGSRILTLSGTYGTVSNIKVHFDGVYQGITSILTLVGNVLTFVDPIPVGVGIIYVDGGIMQQVSVPPTGSVGIGQLAPDALTYFQTQINEVTPNSEVFTLGTGSGKFQTGETSITLAGTYGTLENIKVHFGVAYLGIDQLVSLVGHVLTFVNPIPSGVSEIYIDGGSITTLGIPANASIGVAQLAPDTITYIQSQIGVNTNPTSEVFSVGTGIGTFQVGASSITLAGTYGSLNNIRVFFDAAYQGINQLSSLVGNVLTFAAPIPTEITNIYVDGGNLTVVGVPSNGTIGLAQLAPDALNYLSSVSGTAPTLAGPVTVTSTNSTNSIIVNDAGVNGANIKLIGNGSVTPNKFIRSQNGAFQVVNSTYTSAILNLDDYGNLSASTFNGNIPFTQSGTGAVARTVNAKLNESVSVLDFGADPTGVADSTSAIQLAANLGNVHFPIGNYLVNGIVTFPSGSVNVVGDYSTITFGSGGQFLFPSNSTIARIVGIKCVSNSALSILKFTGTGGLFLNLSDSKFYSGTATSQNLINMVGVYGSMSNCEFNGTSGHMDCVGIQSSSANFAFTNISSHGSQSRSFAYLDGSSTTFGVQGVRFVACTLLNYNNGIIATGGTSGTMDGLQITGCMIDSMQVPLQITNAFNISITGSYLGATSSSISAINLTNCTSVSMSGNNGEMYSSTATWIYINGGTSHSYAGNTLFNLHGKTSIFSGTLPSLMEAVGNSGTNNFISTVGGN